MSVHRFPTVPSRRRMPRWLKILGILAFIVWLGMLANDILILKNPKLFMFDVSYGLGILLAYCMVSLLEIWFAYRAKHGG